MYTLSLSYITNDLISTQLLREIQLFFHGILKYNILDPSTGHICIIFLAINNQNLSTDIDVLGGKVGNI